MIKNFIKRLKQNFIIAIPSIYALFLSFVALRFFEFYSYKNNSLEGGIKIGYLNGGILVDFIFSNVIVLIALLLQSLFFFRKIKKAYFINFIALIFLFVNFILIQVFLITLEPLDEVFYHFSVKELMTISGNGAINLLIIVLFISLLVIFYGSFYLMKKIYFSKRKTIVFACFSIVAICCFPLLNYRSEKHIATKLVNNKSAYFLNRSINYFSENQNANFQLIKIDEEFLGGESISKDFPLMHEFKLDKEFPTLFKVNSKKPPNLVFIIIESLSTQFVGKYSNETGHLMPFLDSLCTKSIYFPNIISTAERTYNVLPAVLCSTPNAPNEERFIRLEYPRHWSMINLLRKDYFSRFYCGVYLGFDHMDRFFKYHEINYAVHSWEKRFNKNFSKENIWGYPDKDLFNKSILDLEKKHSKIKKSRLDIFLTISTHEPYIVPHQEKITQEIINEIRVIKNKSKFHQFIIDHASEYSAYRYTDQCIRSYIEKMKKKKEFENTIFFILGDHGSGLYRGNELSRVSTPIIIFSNLIKKPMIFEELSSHLDVLPSVLNLLNQNYAMDIPKTVPFMGKGLRLNKSFQSNLYQSVSGINPINKFMVYKNYYLYHDQLFKIKKDLKLSPIKNNALKNKLKSKLKKYNQLSSYCVYNDKLIADSDFDKYWNSNTYKLFNLKKLDKIKSKEVFIMFGDKYLINKKCETFKFEVNLNYYLNAVKELSKIPHFTASISIKDSNYVWKQAEPRLNQIYSKGWNKIKYVLELDKKEINNLKDFSITYYFLNTKKKKFFVKDLILKSYIK